MSNFNESAFILIISTKNDVLLFIYFCTTSHVSGAKLSFFVSRVKAVTFCTKSDEVEANLSN